MATPMEIFAIVEKYTGMRATTAEIELAVFAFNNALRRLVHEADLGLRYTSGGPDSSLIAGQKQGEALVKLGMWTLDYRIEHITLMRDNTEYELKHVSLDHFKQITNGIRNQYLWNLPQNVDASNVADPKYVQHVWADQSYVAGNKKPSDQEEVDNYRFILVHPGTKPGDIFSVRLRMDPWPVSVDEQSTLTRDYLEAQEPYQSEALVALVCEAMCLRDGRHEEADRWRARGMSSIEALKQHQRDKTPTTPFRVRTESLDVRSDIEGDWRLST